MTNDLVSMKEIILKLREKKEERGLSLDQIIELIKADNDGFSPVKSTLSKIFREGSEDERFNYEDVIRPVARVLLDIENIEETDTDDVKTLKMFLKVKIQRIQELEQQLEKEKLKHHEKMEKERESWSKSIDFLKEQITYKDSRMNEFSNRISRLLDRLEKKDDRIEQLTDDLIQLKDIKEKIAECPYRDK